MRRRRIDERGVVGRPGVKLEIITLVVGASTRRITDLHVVLPVAGGKSRGRGEGRISGLLGRRPVAIGDHHASVVVHLHAQIGGVGLVGETELEGAALLEIELVVIGGNLRRKLAEDADIRLILRQAADEGCRRRR